MVQVHLGPLGPWHTPSWHYVVTALHRVRHWRRSTVKKLLPLLLAGAAALLVVRRQRSARAEAELWREATTPTV